LSVVINKPGGVVINPLGLITLPNPVEVEKNLRETIERATENMRRQLEDISNQKESSEPVQEETSAAPVQEDASNQQPGEIATREQVGDIGGLLKMAVGQLAAKGADFQTRMGQMTEKEGGITQEDMLNLQFEMGQYNALIESVANVTKSLTDTLKSLAQKVG
jgi:type III secretion protein F